MDLDYILRELGQFGRYQIYIFFLLIFLLVFSTFPFCYVFTAGDLEYRCKIPECDDWDSPKYDSDWLPAALPFTKRGTPEVCLRYRAVVPGRQGNCTEENFWRNQTEQCESFVFTDKDNTIVSEFGLVCKENEWKRTSVGTVNNFGLLVGMSIGGVFSDRFGRKTMVLTATLLSTAMGLMRSFAASYIQFLIFEFLDATFSAAVYGGIFILAIELLGPDKRLIGGTIIGSFYSVGEVVMALAAWYAKDWRILLRILYLPGFLFLAYFWILPESIRWLISNEKHERAKEILRTLSVVNRRPMNEEVKRQVDSLDLITDKPARVEKAEERGPLRQVFGSRMMTWRFINCSFCWITNTFVFYGLSLNSVAVAGNKYSNFILVSLVEVPAYVACWWLSNTLGRRISLFASLAISGAACTSFWFLSPDMMMARMVLFLTGKCAITTSFTVLYVLTSEIFPTSIRHSLLAFCSTVGRIGSMLAPQTPLMAAYIDPVLIFGSISLLAGALALLFPETLNAQLPDTVQEAESLGDLQKKASKSAKSTA